MFVDKEKGKKNHTTQVQNELNYLSKTQHNWISNWPDYLELQSIKEMHIVLFLFSATYLNINFIGNYSE